MIAVFAAMEPELAGLARHLIAREHETIAGRRVVRGRCGGENVLVCRTGIGDRVEGAMRAVLERYEASSVLSAGVAGALDPGLRAGDLLLCETLVCGGDPQAPAILSDARLLEAAASAAGRAGLRVRRGRSLTMDGIAGDPAVKAELRLTTGADVVEMESHRAGRIAVEKGLPFLAARAVLDEAADPLPGLPGVVAPDGSTRMWAVLPYLIAHPRRLPLLLRLARCQRQAMETLGLFLEAFAGLAPALPLAGGRPA
jgi:adenosylhomocysteine nucleosidase